MSTRPAPRRGRREPVATVASVVAAVVFAAPLLFMVVGAFKPGSRVLADSTSWRAFWPEDGSLHNFGQAIDRAQFLLLLRNSLIVSSSVVAGGLVVNSMAGYALARFRFPGRRLLLVAVVALAVVPFQAVAIPLLYLMSGWGWRNTFAALIVPFIANPFYIYLFRSFFLSIPAELEEAARVDGAGPGRVFVSIAVPLARPAFATVGILAFISSWAELLWPALITDRVEVRTLPLGISVFRSVPPIDQGIILAFVVLAALPMFALFFVLQRQFIASVARTGIRG